MYHGSPAERAELRRTVMALPSSREPKKRHPSSARERKGRPTARSKAKSKAQPPQKSKVPPRRNQRRSARFTRVVDITSDEEEEIDEEVCEDTVEQENIETPPVHESENEDGNDDHDAMASFPVVITTYEMIIKDRVHLANYNWGYIVVDEGHRLKNLNCRLIKEIKKYTSAGRMLLTGTPLHVRFSFALLIYLDVNVILVW